MGLHKIDLQERNSSSEVPKAEYKELGSSIKGIGSGPLGVSSRQAAISGWKQKVAP